MNTSHILIVEDDPLLSSGYQARLEALGYGILGPVDNGPEALKLAQKQVPDLIMLDIDLQGPINGIELARQLRETVIAPIIFVTGLQADSFFREALAVEPTAYLNKPLPDDRELERLVELALSRHQAASPPEEQTAPAKEFFFMMRNTRHERVAVQDVLFVKASGSYIEITTKTGHYTQSINLKRFFHLVNHPDLCRISRSYGVNLRNVEAIEWPYLLIRDQRLLVTTAHKEEVLKQLNILSTS